MKITYLRVDIEPTSPFRVGSLGGVRNALAVETDSNGVPVVPASGLAGNFRVHIGEAEANRHMGRVESTKGGSLFVASELWFLGTTLDETAEKRPRTATAIDRRRRAARNDSSHTVEEVYDATLIKLYLRYESPAEDILDLLATWPVLIGGGVSSGLGQARITGIRYRTLDMSKAEDVLARASLSAPGAEALDTLLADAPDYLAEDGAPAPAKGMPVVFSASCRIQGLNVPVDALTDEPRSDHFWFRGTSWKGVLRSRVEYIGRSLGLDVCGTDGGTWDGCGRCGVCEAFGSSATGVGRWSFSFTKLAEDAARTDRTRGAIDRFTGGAAEISKGDGGGTRSGRLFPERTLSDENARLTVGLLVEEELDPRHFWVRKALLLALRDLDEGFIGIGGRTATGLGTVTFDNLTLGSDLADTGVEPETGLSSVPRITQQDLDAALQPKEEQ